MKFHALGLGLLLLFIAASAVHGTSERAAPPLPASDAPSLSFASAKRGITRCSIVADTAASSRYPTLPYPVRFSVEAAPGESVAGIVDFHHYSPGSTAAFRYQLSGEGALALALGTRSTGRGKFKPSASGKLSGNSARVVADADWLVTASCAEARDEGA